MKHPLYLYGDDFDATTLRELPVEQYLQRKIIASQELVELLMREPLETRDFRRINESLESQKFNLVLLDELYGRNGQ